ncbi:uncharacterized protein CLAFUR5_10006 [Fulvia fulva]|uniref:Uncharacterized protein n=1 Tax=Passalora fulva TaxID=5499 RepID=A0A9Q8PCA7_PASFU|nr:uncharacterized protein CLAFUR5_10006 [Fulvia fulva]UJO19830.1 hypothetical protein CLAFUR5_10006 [Fulvia fulva]
MPSRKADSESSATKSDIRRTSLRRLSSIASLHSLNPFHRRRSNNNTLADTPATSTSNLSLISTVVNAPECPKDLIFAEHETAHVNAKPPQPAQPHLPSRRSSYICLPDDPIGGMPRSRTFSNLPIPTRLKKTSNPLAQSKSHARLPSTVQPPRLPSPPRSSRKHSITRLAGIENIPASARKALPRSDTEPLLQASHDYRGPHVARSTAFKENITLSPIKPLPSLDMVDTKDFYSQSPTYVSAQNWSNIGDLTDPLPSPSLGLTNSFSSSTLSLTKYRALPEGAYKRLSQKYDSCPAYRSAKERVPTPGQAVQRWNSQPVLGAKSSRRSSHGEIKQARLMSTRGAPTPPPPKTPLGTQVLNQAKSRTTSSSSTHLLPVMEQVIASENELPGTSSRRDSVVDNPRAVRVYEPPAYWTGRFSTLNDRYRNEELLECNILTPSRSSEDWVPKSHTDKIHTPDANCARMRRAIELLHSQCATDEAKRSFYVWQKQLAVALQTPELAKPVAGARHCQLEMSLKDHSSSPGSPFGSGRKVSFLDRLLGRKERSFV